MVSLNEEIKRLEEELKQKEIELIKKREEQRVMQEAIREAERNKARDKRKEEHEAGGGGELSKSDMHVSAKLDDLPTITTADYFKLDLNEIKDKIKENDFIRVRFSNVAKQATGKPYVVIEPSSERAMDFKSYTNSFIIRKDPNDKDRIHFDLVGGGKVEFSKGTISRSDEKYGEVYFSLNDNQEIKHNLEGRKKEFLGNLVSDEAFMAKFKEEMAKKRKEDKIAKDIQRLKNIVHPFPIRNEVPEVKENNDTKMVPQVPYKIMIDKLPEMQMAGVIGVNLAQYKEELESLKNGEKLTFGRKAYGVKAENGEKIIGIDDLPNTVSRKHFSIEKINGEYYVKDTSLNGTSIRTAKRDRRMEMLNQMKKGPRE